MWARLHGKKTDEFETDDDEDSRIGEPETPASSVRPTPANSDDEGEENETSVRGDKNKKNKIEDDEEEDGEEDKEQRSPSEKRKHEDEEDDLVNKRARV
jgi:hypothetical protein